MAKILGIDAGTNSLALAIRDTDEKENQITDTIVLTFDKGVAEEKGNEFPKVQKRTESRGKRRNYQAEKYRKWLLLEFLIAKGMCPLTLEELDMWRKYEKGRKRVYPQSKVFLNWLRFDFDGDGLPDFHLFGKDKVESHYIFRACVIKDEFKVVFAQNPHILGRIFYQLVQRRGFRGRDEEEAKTMLKGSEKTGTAGRDDIAEYIAGYKTLGAALYHYQKDKNVRIRKRYNLRKDFESELKTICDFHGISQEDYEKLWKAIIWQRPLKSQKGLVGNCIYEQNKKRVPVSHPLYEEYRTWVFINNLKITPPEGISLEEYLNESIYPLFYKSSDFEMKTIFNQIKKDKAFIDSKFTEKTKVVSAKLLKLFQDLLGDDWKEKYAWNDIQNRDAQQGKRTEKYYTFEDIWHILNTFDDTEKLKQFAVEKLNLDEEKADKFSKIKFNQGYATLSLSAIKKLLPYLRKGFQYNKAVYLANLHKVLGTNEVSDELVNYFSEEIQEILDNHSKEKVLSSIVNALIEDELNDEYRYAIEDDRPLDEAEKTRILTKIKAIIGEKSWNDLDEEERNQYFDFVGEKFLEFLKKGIREKSGVFTSQMRLHDRIFTFFQEKYGLSDDRKKYLWHPSEQENYKAALEYEHFILNGKNIYIPVNEMDIFIRKNPDAERQFRSLKLLGNPEPDSKGLKNPMALKTMHKLKQVINYLLQIGKIDEDTRVVVELARELNDANKRKAIKKWQEDREKENDQYRKRIEEHNQKYPNENLQITEELVKKYRLWQEQGKMCMYTGKEMSFSEAMNGTKYDIEHTIPASMSFDNELKNLTLADSDYNRNVKGKQFPSQLMNYEEEKEINGKRCSAIISNIEVLFGKRTVEYKKDKKGNYVKDKKGNFIKEVRWKKITDLENQYEEYKTKASNATTKDIKDACIQRYHYIKMDLDYLKAKLHTFTLTEYKSTWKNSQLKDTQIITKYALPYLKTVFKKVSVEKGTVVNAFKEIYEVKFPWVKKDRKVHSHHAIDAAILTLIPSHYHRDKMLEKYNEYKDEKKEIYHEKPKDWKDFKPSYILEIENKVFINNLIDNKTILQTFKAVRKKGKIVWLDKENKIKKIAQGDTIRGQLHGESLYGAIKLPVRNEEGKILFDENNNMILQDKIFIVKRRNLLDFNSLKDLDKAIVNKDLYKMIESQIGDANYKDAVNKGVFMKDKKGNFVGQKIRRVRCFENLKYENIIKVHQHQFESDKEYKKFTLATNGENTYCLLYKNDKGRAMRILSIVDLAELKLKNTKQIWQEPEFQQVENGKGKNKIEIPLYAILQSGQKVIFYKDDLQELKDLDVTDLSKRMYKVYQFESDGRMKFKHHLAAGVDTELKKNNPEYSSVDFSNYQMFLRLSKGEWNFAIEGVDFDMTLDGKINWKI